jgi:hypothetical protein
MNEISKEQETSTVTKPLLSAVDFKYLGIPNICFSITDKEDKRETYFKKQRIERGLLN